MISANKLNFGCGYDKKSGYLNVDMDEKCQPDLLLKNGDTSEIPRKHFEHVLAKDVLEHIERTETLSALLDFADFLVVDGRLELETSSILGIAERLGQKNDFVSQYGWTTCLFGTQAPKGRFSSDGLHRDDAQGSPSGCRL